MTFAGLDIGELSRRPLDDVAELLRPAAEGDAGKRKRNNARTQADTHPEQAIAAQRIAADLRARIEVVQALGLGYLSLERSTPTLSPGELQRLRLATQIRSQLFGVVYVMDEPSAGLHPADAQALLGALDQLKAAGNSVFVVEHEVDVIRHADWIVDVGPAAGVHGGQVLYSGPPAGLEQVDASSTRRYLFGTPPQVHSHARDATGWLQLRGITRNNVRALDVDLPLGVFTTVTGVSGSGKSSLVSQALVELLAAHLGQTQAEEDEALDPLERGTQVPLGGAIVGGLDQVRRLVRVDQKPIAAHRVRIWPPIPACSIRYASYSPPPRPRVADVTTRGSFRSMSPRAAAPPAKAKARCTWNCCSCPASTHRAPPAMARATTPRPWRSNCVATASRRCWK